MTISLRHFESKLPGFKTFLSSSGAELLVSTNQWEVLRFRTADGTSVVYKKASGILTFTGEAQEAWSAYREQKRWKPKLTTADGRRHPRPRSVPPVLRTIRARDGDLCFFCWKEVSDESASMEHLVAVTAGGPSHISNLFLAHKLCNSRAGHLSAPEKIALHVKGALAYYADGGHNGHHRPNVGQSSGTGGGVYTRFLHPASDQGLSAVDSGGSGPDERSEADG